MGLWEVKQLFRGASKKANVNGKTAGKSNYQLQMGRADNPIRIVGKGFPYTLFMLQTEVLNEEKTRYEGLIQSDLTTTPSSPLLMCIHI